VTDADLAARLGDVVAALRVLATTTADDGPWAVGERVEAVREAGAAFDDALARVSGAYVPVFGDADGDLDFDLEDDLDDLDDLEDDLDEDEDDACGLEGEGDVEEPGVRFSVRIREDFRVVDEAAFVASAGRALAEKDVGALDEVRVDLMALIDSIGLQNLVFGGPVDGLESVGGARRLVVDQHVFADDEG
jgi:hypothetical protein